MNWLRGLFSRRGEYLNFADEIEEHLAEKVDELIGQGMSPEQARWAAQRDFGNLTRIKEQGYDVWRWHWIGDALADLRYALRHLGRSPAFALGAVTTLALGIGANSAIYSVMNAALFRPVLYRDPGRLILAWTGDPEQVSFYSFSYPRFEFFRNRLSGVVDLAAYDDEIVTITDQGEPERIEGGRVSANFFSVLGVKPALGRGFLPSEDQHSAAPVALLSDSYWRKRYGAASDILGRAVHVDGEVFTIVGVLPPGFEFRNQPVDIWRTRIIDTRTFAPESVRLGAAYLTAVGRLCDGVLLRQVQAKLAVLDTQYRKERRGTSDESRIVYTSPLEDQIFAGAHAAVRTVGHGKLPVADRLRQRGEPRFSTDHRAAP
jgi:hypothetical protein